MNCDTPGAKIVDFQYATDYISTEVVEYQYLPYGLPFRIQYRCGLRYQSVRGYGVMLLIRLALRFLIEVEKFLDRSWGLSLSSGRPPNEGTAAYVSVEPSM